VQRDEEREFLKEHIAALVDLDSDVNSQIGCIHEYRNPDS
jgi:hypothetical protein